MSKDELSLNPNIASIIITVWIFLLFLFLLLLFFFPHLPRAQQRNSGGCSSNPRLFQWRWCCSPLHSNTLQTHILTEFKKTKTTLTLFQSIRQPAASPVPSSRSRSCQNTQSAPSIWNVQHTRRKKSSSFPAYVQVRLFTLVLCVKVNRTGWKRFRTRLLPAFTTRTSPPRTVPDLRWTWAPNRAFPLPGEGPDCQKKQPHRSGLLQICTF